MIDQSSFMWNELATSDQRSSSAFFSQFFDGPCMEVDAGPFGINTLFQRNRLDVAEIMNPTLDISGNGSFGHSYIAVEDIELCVKHGSLLGESIAALPHDVTDIDMVCVVADPAGDIAHLMQPLKRA